jgi:hypothetical protein
MLSEPKASGGQVALFDLDGTLTFHDTLMPFLLGYMGRHPARLAATWRLAPALAGYAVARDRGLLKSRVIRLALCIPRGGVGGRGGPSRGRRSSGAALREP